jgi:methionine synthase I (cobalamin-dependent)
MRTLGTFPTKQLTCGLARSKAWAKDSLWNRLRRRGLSLEVLARRVAKKARLDPKSLFIKGRIAPVSKAKAILIYTATEYLEKTIQEMAEMTEILSNVVDWDFGSVSYPATNQAAASSSMPSLN